MALTRYKSGFDYRNKRAGVHVRMFAKETDSRLYYLPEEAAYSTKWCDKREWPFTSFDEAKAAAIQAHIEQIAALEREIEEHRAAVAALEAATQPIQSA